MSENETIEELREKALEAYRKKKEAAMRLDEVNALFGKESDIAKRAKKRYFENKDK